MVWLNALLEAGADCFATACTNAVVMAHATGSACVPICAVTPSASA
jgi:hypothetical protein